MRPESAEAIAAGIVIVVLVTALIFLTVLVSHTLDLAAQAARDCSRNQSVMLVP